METPTKFCINCQHHKPVPCGLPYCGNAPRSVDLVDGKERFAHCFDERADADKCGTSARNFVAKEGK